jgi:hypothetical protein
MEEGTVMGIRDESAIPWPLQFLEGKNIVIVGAICLHDAAVDDHLSAAWDIASGSGNP